MENLTLNEWAKRHNVSTLYDYDKFENREFLKKLDESRPLYENIKRKNIEIKPEIQKENIIEKLRYLLVWEKNLS
jgi:translation initiation factor IF-3